MPPPPPSNRQNALHCTKVRYLFPNPSWSPSRCGLPLRLSWASWGCRFRLRFRIRFLRYFRCSWARTARTQAERRQHRLIVFDLLRTCDFVLSNEEIREIQNNWSETKKKLTLQIPTRFGKLPWSFWFIDAQLHNSVKPTTYRWREQFLCHFLKLLVSRICLVFCDVGSPWRSDRMLHTVIGH